MDVDCVGLPTNRSLGPLPRRRKPIRWTPLTYPSWHTSTSHVKKTRCGAVDGKAGDELYVQLGVPVIDVLQTIDPLLLYLHLEPIGESPYLPPVTLRAGVHSKCVSEDFFEPFRKPSWLGGETWCFRRGKVDRCVASGESTGKLWLAVGTREDFLMWE